MRTSRIISSAVCCVLLAACASSGTAGATRRGGNTITSEELQEPALAGLNAYEAVQRLRPNWLRERGTGSIRQSSDNFPKVIINDIPYTLDYLKSVSVPQIVEMQFISASDATTRFGTGFPNGAVMVSTTQRPD